MHPRSILSTADALNLRASSTHSSPNREGNGKGAFLAVRLRASRGPSGISDDDDVAVLRTKPDGSYFVDLANVDDIILRERPPKRLKRVGFSEKKAELSLSFSEPADGHDVSSIQDQLSAEVSAVLCAARTISWEKAGIDHRNLHQRRSQVHYIRSLKRTRHGLQGGCAARARRERADLGSNGATLSPRGARHLS